MSLEVYKSGKQFDIFSKNLAEERREVNEMAEERREVNEMATPPSWLGTGIKGVLLDIFGVLQNSNSDGKQTPIEGSIEAVRRLKDAAYPVRFCSNNSQRGQIDVVKQLQKAGFSVAPHEVFTPIPAIKNILKEKNLRPYLLIHEDARKSFADINQDDPNCVVVGDAETYFTYEAMNSAFNVLLQSPMLFSMGIGKYYRKGGKLALNTGCYAKALEYACSVEATIVGKPSSDYFLTAVRNLQLEPSEVVMVGDDIVNDVGGAQNCGIRGVQVRTGKYRASDEPHDTVTPAGYVDNLAQAVDLIIKYNS